MPAVGEWSNRVGNPECTKYCACASKTTKDKVSAQFAKAPKLHKAQRLCIKNDLRSENCWIGLSAQNARSTAPVHHKQPRAR